MSSKKLQKDILVLVLAIALVITLGALVFHFLEGWPLVDSFYFAAMTATTVGYGDLVPTSNLSKIITIIYALSIVPFVLYGFTAVAKAQSEKITEKLHKLERSHKKLKTEVLEHDKELEVVEKVMEKELTK